MQSKWVCVLMVSAFAGASLCHAASTAETDEVVVNGTPLHELRAAVLAAEERFYARYNELNKVDDFDVACTIAPPTGTRLNRRICRTMLQLNALAEQGREFVQNIQNEATLQFGTPSRTPLVTDADYDNFNRYQDYKENVLYLLKMNPDLRRLVRERVEAEKRYDAERKRRFKERWLAY